MRKSRYPTVETKEKMRLAKLGENNPMYGKHHSKTSRDAISKKMKDYWATLPRKLG